MPPAEVGLFAVDGGFESRDFGRDFGLAGGAVLVDAAAGAAKVPRVPPLQRGFEGLGSAGDEGHIVSGSAAGAWS